METDGCRPEPCCEEGYPFDRWCSRMICCEGGFDGEGYIPRTDGVAAELEDEEGPGEEVDAIDDDIDDEEMPNMPFSILACD